MFIHITTLTALIMNIAMVISAGTPYPPGKQKNMTPWILFLIFVLGPCEPLIPIVMYPAAENNIHGVIIVSLLFSVVTIATMMSVVLAFRLGLSHINFSPLERYVNVIAGATILVSGLAIQFLGL
jgi:hypothetical protein